MSTIACGPIEAEMRARITGARARMGMLAVPPKTRATPPALPPPKDVVVALPRPKLPPPGAVSLIGPPSSLVIIALVALKHGVAASDIIGRRQGQRCKRARVEAVHLVRQHTGQSLPMMGRLFANRDHTSILHLLRRPMQ